MIPKTNIDELRQHLMADNYLAFTIDVDWASDPAIEKLVGYLRGAGIPLTIFCTHPSKAIDAYRGDPDVELGIHPNFCGNSSQGDTMDEIIAYCMQVVPNARCVRGHRWFASNDMYDRLVARGILFDSNDASMLDLAQPYLHRSGMLRLPVFFEDGGFLWNGAKLSFEEEGRQYFERPGLKVLDLHPIHFALNSPTNAFYRSVGDGLPRKDYMAMDANTIARIAYKGYGMRDYIMDLVAYAKANGLKFLSLGQVFDQLVFFER